MDSIVIIDEKEVKFRATARTPRLYRALVGRDMIADMNKLQKAYEKRKKDGDDLGICHLLISFQVGIGDVAGADQTNFNFRHGRNLLVRCILFRPWSSSGSHRQF